MVEVEFRIPCTSISNDSATSKPGYKSYGEVSLAITIVITSMAQYERSKR